MTSKGALLPPLNRTGYHIADHNGHGLFAYGSRGCIYTLDLKLPIPTIIDSKVLRNAHRGKILSLSFCKSKGSEFIACISEDPNLKIWDLETATCIASLKIKEQSCQVVEWLYDSTNSVVFCEPGGYVCKWNFNTNNHIQIKTASERNITVMSSNQKAPELLAVGHCVGTISILNVNNQTCMKSLRAHSMEITSLSWSIISPNSLISASQDLSARVWNIEEDKPLHTYYYPSARYKDKSDDKKNLKICCAFHPENPNVIICSNVRGAVGSVILSENAPPKFTPYVADDFDNVFKGVFQMLPYIDVTGQNKHILLTCEPIKISLWNISDERLLSSFMCVNANIFDLSISPINNNLLAVGSGDGFLKVLNLQSEEKLNVTTIYINLRMKIMTIAWHPTEENIIAYGSDEGRVGIVDFSKKKNMYSFETHHTNSVYALQWGPCKKLNDSKDAYFLYSCGGGFICIHQLHKSKEKAVAFETLLNLPADIELDHKKSYSELCWKSDYSCLAVGTYEGSVYLYSDKFDFLCIFSLQLKNLENLRWHPKHTYSSYSKESKYSSWLAAVGNDENIHVFDASDVLNHPSGAAECKAIKTLVGHKKRVSSLCWSIHTDGQLVSGSRDGIVQVWDVITGTPTVNYMGHKDIVYAVQWSVLDPDIIYSGGLDNCLRIWRISEQNQSAIPSKSLIAKYKPFKVPKHKVPHDVSTISETPNSSKNGLSESKSNAIEPSNPSEVGSSDNIKMNMKQPKLKSDVMKDKDNKGIFFAKMFSKEQSFLNIFKLVDFICDEEDDSNSENSKQEMTSDDLLSFGLFTDQFTVLKLLEAKAKVEEQNSMTEKAGYLQMMIGNVAEFLTIAAEKKQLTDFLVSISPSVSHSLWLNMCEKYAIQLVEEQQFLKSSMYFLLCGKLYDALKMLMEKGRILDALALAKARLPESDPIITTILHKAGHYYRIAKQIENEAACYLALKTPHLAAKILYCVGEAKYAYAAAYICHKFNLAEVAHEYALMCVGKCMLQNDWPTFYKVAEVVESVKIYKVLVRVHELISEQIKILKKEDGLIASKIFGVTGSKILIWDNKSSENTNPNYLLHIYEVLKTENLLPEDKEVLQSIHQALILFEAAEKSKMSSEAHVSVAIYMSQVIITSLLGDQLSATKYFIKIFPCTYNVVFIPRIICGTFFPLDLYWDCNKNNFICDVKKSYTDALPAIAHIQNLFESIGEKFGGISYAVNDIFTANSDIISNLDNSVQQVLTHLSQKTAEESFCLYFSAQYLNELRRLAKKGWRFRCYENNTISDSILKGETCMPETEAESRLVCSDSNIHKDSAAVIEEILKNPSLQNLVPKEKLPDNSGQNIQSIVDTFEQVFVSELDSKEKSSQKKMPSEDELSSEINRSCQKVECSINLSLEEEDLHAQCWTDVSLYYVLIKALCSIICKDDYALMHYLKKYQQNLDSQIADLARSQSRSNSNQKSNTSKISKISNQKEREKNPQNNKQSKTLNTHSESSISNCISDTTLLASNNDNATLNIDNKSSNGNEIDLETDFKESKNVSEDGATLCFESERITLENEINSCNGHKLSENEVDLLNEQVLETVLLNMSLEPASEIVNSSDAVKDINSNLSDSVQQNTNCDMDSIIIKKEEIKSEDSDKKRVDSEIMKEKSVTEDCNDIFCNTQTGKTEENSRSFQSLLQTQNERICEHVKSLQFEEFWYPDPFMSVSDIMGICCDIFHKHPCALIKQKFHELGHEVNQWYVKYSVTKESNTCEICKKISA